MKLFIFSIFLIFLGLPIVANTPTTSIYSSYDSIIMEVYTENDYEVIVTNLEYINGNLRFLYEDDEYSADTLFSDDFSLIRQEINVLKEDIVAELGFRRSLIEYDNNGNQFCIIEKENGREKRTRIRFDSILLQDFYIYYIPGLFIDNGTHYDMTMKFYTSSNNVTYDVVYTAESILSTELENRYSEFNFPEEVDLLLNNGNELIVVLGELTGIAKSFWPYRFYTVLDPNNNYLAVFQWGESPNGNYYTITRFE